MSTTSPGGLWLFLACYLGYLVSGLASKSLELRLLPSPVWQAVVRGRQKVSPLFACSSSRTEGMLVVTQGSPEILGLSVAVESGCPHRAQHALTTAHLESTHRYVLRHWPTASEPNLETGVVRFGHSVLDWVLGTTTAVRNGTIDASGGLGQLDVRRGLPLGSHSDRRSKDKTAFCQQTNGTCSRWSLGIMGRVVHAQSQARRAPLPFGLATFARKFSVDIGPIGSSSICFQVGLPSIGWRFTQVCDGAKPRSSTIRREVEHLPTLYSYLQSAMSTLATAALSDSAKEAVGFASSQFDVLGHPPRWTI